MRRQKDATHKDIGDSGAGVPYHVGAELLKWMRWDAGWMAEALCMHVDCSTPHPGISSPPRRAPPRPCSRATDQQGVRECWMPRG